MKTFFNVLYRRILYKIPLKLLLILLAVFGVLFACFSNATLIQKTVYPNQDNFIYKSDYGNPDVLCFSDPNKCTILYAISNNGLFANPLTFDDYAQINNGNVLNYVCTVEGDGFDIVPNNNNCVINIFYPNNFTSLQCQTEYNLIPISSVDQNYCTTNNLCPSCPICPEVPFGSGDYSQLYINNILHLGAPNIIMNIPDEIDWDYAYTAGGQNMNIDVVGYNVDYEKIDSIVSFQNYKPSSEDFQHIISLLAPYTKIIVFFVFLFIVWAWIKKPFKSKKF